ncbi:DUF4139 domain-containing protein [Streptomyces sp. ALI-76-A]|uniref:DUF4139 domain-containing protein n=1 Tax=Streptomyces sp. ALI-76-A TaxID=3025736 RepID=UPI00256F49C1|nr:DUF4139 domain-containing protein [Streptomyces sp. ALI-76-A]MDL5205828.1 DUF4139 domain-containing protein [Streptomyces sp. ALI-76-A]
MKAETTPRWSSTLDAVVVYAQGALCSRTARGTVPASGRVRVTGLPRAMEPGSLRARVVGASGLRSTELRVETDAEPLVTGTADVLRREVERLRDERAAAEGRRDRQLSLIKEVTAVHPVPPTRRREDPHRVTPVDAWLELADFVDERLTGLHARLVELEEALRLVGHELAVAQDALVRASTDAPAAHVQTTVDAVLTLDGSGDAEVELEYLVPGAVWVPAYRLTHRQGERGGRLVLRASVAQRTGEDWTGVRIALATADLRRRTDLPKLRSIRIGRRQAAPAPFGWREPPAGLADLFAGYEAAGPRPASGRAGTPVTAAAVGGPSSGPSFVPPPAPQGYGGPSAAPEVSGGVGGVPPQAFGGGMPDFAQSARPRTDGMARAGGSYPAPALMAPAAPGMPPPPAPPAAGPASAQMAAGAPQPPPRPAPVTGPPQPSGAELDYAALVLSGPDEQGDRRGRLFPASPFDPVAAEYRRRAEAVAGLPLPRHAVRPRQSAGSFDHRFDAVARADIPSDGTWHTVTVTEIPVELHTEYLCVPSVERTVYATLLLSNATDQALLAGPVEVIVDDDYLLTAALPTLAPGGVRRVGLGPAEGVQVTRRTNLHESTSGLRNNTTVLDHRVQVELANRLAKPVTVEVREQIPVTSDPDVRIEERADWTAPEVDAGHDHHAPGTRVWRVHLPAGGTAALLGGYEIRIPAGKALVGGNRRS